MKKLTIYNIVILIFITTIFALVLTGCADPSGGASGGGSGGTATLSINLGDSNNFYKGKGNVFGGVSGFSANSTVLPWPPTSEMIANMTFTITLTGNGQPITLNASGAETITTTVSAGHWNVKIDAYYPNQNQRYATGTSSVNAIAGRNTSVSIIMIEGDGGGGGPSGPILHVGNYTLFVEADKPGIRKNDGSGDLVQFDEISWNGTTLILTNFSFTTTAAHALVLENGGTIVLNGKNELTSSNYNGDDETSSAINAKDNLTIQGSGSLTVKSGTAENSSRGIYVEGDLVISDATVTATGGDNEFGDESLGISVDGQLRINGATVEATGGTVDSGDSIGVSSVGFVHNSGDVTMSGNNSAVLDANALNGISVYGPASIWFSPTANPLVVNFGDNPELVNPSVPWVRIRRD